MKTEICKNTEELVEIAAKAIQKQLEVKPESVLALACGETMKPLWARLAELFDKGQLRMLDARIFCAAELCGVEDDKTCRHALTAGLIEKTDMQPENCFFPDPDNPEGYDRLIEKLGGEVAGILVMIELAGLNGRKKLEGYRVDSALTYEGK